MLSVRQHMYIYLVCRSTIPPTILYEKEDKSRLLLTLFGVQMHPVLLLLLLMYQGMGNIHCAGMPFLVAFFAVSRLHSRIPRHFPAVCLRF